MLDQEISQDALKMRRYRLRKKLREAGHTEAEIAQELASAQLLPARATSEEYEGEEYEGGGGLGWLLLGIGIIGGAVLGAIRGLSKAS